MRVLFLTTQFPRPATSGGPVRTLAQLRALASLDEVERIALLSVAEKPVDAAECRALEVELPKLRVAPPVSHPIHLWRQPRRVPRVVALRALGVPYLAGKWDSPRLRDALRGALRESPPPDVVYLDHLGLARYLPDVRREAPRARVVLDQHNVESAFFAQLAEGRGGPLGLAARAEWRAAARFERQALRSVDAVVAISASDARDFEQLAGVRAQLVPVVVEPRREAPPPASGARFCYVGSLGWRPNVAGLDWLCGQVWPRVHSRLPDAALEIAGVGLAPDARGRLPVPASWRVPGVETLGFVEDLAPLYARSVALLAPVRGGSGVRIKVLEGFRAGLPVVTTPDGAAGLPLRDGEEALIAGDADGFAERAVRLVRDEPLRTRLRERAWAYLEEHHSAAAARAALRTVLGIAPAVPPASGRRADAE